MSVALNSCQGQKMNSFSTLVQCSGYCSCQTVEFHNNNNRRGIVKNLRVATVGDVLLIQAIADGTCKHAKL